MLPLQVSGRDCLYSVSTSYRFKICLKLFFTQRVYQKNYTCFSYQDPTLSDSSGLEDTLTASTPQKQPPAKRSCHVFHSLTLKGRKSSTAVSALPNPCPPLVDDEPERRPKGKGTNDKSDVAVIQKELLALEKQRATIEIEKLVLEKRKLLLEIDVLNMKKQKLATETQHVMPVTSQSLQHSHYPNNNSPFDYSLTSL